MKYLTEKTLPMDKNTTPLEKLQSFLNKLFQFESQELDFGVYKILHYKRTEIKQFINELLVDRVKEQLQVLTLAQSQEALQKLQELEHDDIIKGWLSADENEKNTLLKYGKDKIEHYQELQQQVQHARVSVETENLIYNHLTLFFSRYYDKGDFISKRRFGKNEKYVVPYNGEETHFYWANQDQYYIKSSESFQKYAFKVPHGSGNLIVNFKLTEAETEQGNVKANEARYFILSAKPAGLSPSPSGEGRGEVLDIFFEYRAFTEDEKKTYTGNKQDVLDAEAADKIKAAFKNEPLCINLWAADDKGESLLLQHLHRYTRKNSYDFFIHKNLKGFLQRELDFYIKSELVNVDDLYVSENDEHFNHIKHNLKTIKVFKLIADTIIEFLAQLEEFQKKLWEKKKFVLSTEWVITIDRLVEYIGIETATPLLLEVIANKKQLDEWIELFGKENIPACPLTIDLLKADAFAWRKLPIDTVHFPAAFKENLLNALSAKINLEEKADGLILHSDNYHGLVLIGPKFHDIIKIIYIDPPFNLGTEPEYNYKVDYKDSTWLSLLEPRLAISKYLLNPLNGSIFIRCNHDGNFLVRSLMNISFGEENFRNEIIVRRAELNKGDLNKQFDSVKSITVNYDNVYWYSRSFDSRFERFLKKTSVEQANSQWHSFWKAENRPNLRYEIKGVNLEKGQWMWSKERAFKALENYEKYLVEFANSKISLDEYWEKTGKNQEFLWKFGDNNIIGSIKYWIPPREFVMSDNNWLDIKGYSNNWRFKTENSELLLKRIIDSQSKHSDYILDYFLGSGTTVAASQKLKRKWIGIEAGDQFFTFILPRMKKVLYGEESGITKEAKFKGGGFFKYQRLEQYEEALENIAFTAPEESMQKALEFDQYIPKYFLNFETQGSPTLVNTDAMANPWAYNLKVWDGYTYDNEQPVDLVETFNYLIGLHMQKCVTKQINGQNYQFVSGHNNAGKQLLVVWRNTAGWQLPDYEADRQTLLAELEAFTYDQLYISGQAHIEGYQPIEEIFKNKMMS